MKALIMRKCIYRRAFNVGRILYRVATLRNIAKDLLSSLMI